MRVVIHTNQRVEHQVLCAQALQTGFQRHGIAAEITHDPQRDGDVHIVNGPHYALRHWVTHPRAILVDQVYYRDRPTTRDHVSGAASIGWLEPDGGRRFSEGTGRAPPEIAEHTGGRGRIFLADYRGPVDAFADAVRYHPENQAPREPLVDELARYREAIGYRTTALVTAALMGLDVVVRDTRNILARDNWLQLLPYADWTYSEMQSGDAWAHLRDTEWQQH